MTAPEKTQGEARTPPSAGFAGDQVQADPQRDAIAAALAMMQPQADLPGLADEPPDDLDTLGRVAEQVNAQRRVRGRPSGSANRRNAEVFDYLEARGFKAPEVRLMEIASADTRALAAALSGAGSTADSVAFDKVLDVLKLQMKAAEALMPYKFAKRQELKVEHSGGQLHVMVAQPLSAPSTGTGQGFSLTGEVIDIATESAKP